MAPTVNMPEEFIVARVTESKPKTPVKSYDQGYGKGMMLKGKGKGSNVKGKGSSSKVDPTLKVWIGGLPETLEWKDLQAHMKQAGETKWIEVFTKKNTGYVVYESADAATNAINTLNGSQLGGQAIEVDTWEKKEKSEEQTKPNRTLKSYDQGYGQGYGYDGYSMGMNYSVMSMMGGAWWMSMPMMMPCWGGMMPAGKGMYGKGMMLKGKGKGRKGKGKGSSSKDPALKVWIGGLPEKLEWKDLETFVNAAGKAKWIQVFTKGKEKSTGYVEYETADAARNAINMLNGSELGGQTIQVDVWEKKEKP